MEKPKTIISDQLITEGEALVPDERETDIVLTGNGKIVRSQLMQFFRQNPIP